MPVVLPTWTECTTHRGRTQINSMVLSGTTGKGPATRSRPRPWWSAQQISKCLRTPEERCLPVFKDLIPKLWKTQLHAASLSSSDRLTALQTEGTRELPVRAPSTSPLKPASLNEPKHNPQRATAWHGDLVESLREDKFKLANETDNLQALLSQPRMLCASRSVNNWKTEHLCHIVEITLELHSSEHCL